MKMKKFCALMLTAAMAATLLAGCGNDPGSQGSSQGGEAQGGEAQGGEAQGGEAQGDEAQGGGENASGGGGFR